MRSAFEFMGGINVARCVDELKHILLAVEIRRPAVKLTREKFLCWNFCACIKCAHIFGKSAHHPQAVATLDWFDIWLCRPSKRHLRGDEGGSLLFGKAHEVAKQNARHTQFVSELSAKLQILVQVGL